MQVSIKVSDYVPDHSESLEVDFRLLIASLVKLVNDSDLEIVNGLVSRKKLELGKDSLSFRGPDVWTCLDKKARECDNTDEFKRGLKISINKTARVQTLTDKKEGNDTAVCMKNEVNVKRLSQVLYQRCVRTAL